MKESLKIKVYPALLREVGNKDEVHPVDYKSFKEILRNFSQLKIDGKLNDVDTEDFKKDLLNNESADVILFVEKSLKISLLHPYVFIMLFSILKELLAQGKISKEKYSLLCDALITQRKKDISKYYDFKRLRMIVLSV